MKHISITLFLILNLLTAFGQGMAGEQERLVYDFIECIKSQNKEKLMAKISFPFKRQYPIPPIKDKQAFLDRYHEVFDEKLTEIIANSRPSRDWSAVGLRGIMLLNGLVWLDYDGNLIAVNYQSHIEARKKDELINSEKSQLHESIQNYQQPACILESANYRIRIDDMGGGNYRYASWKSESNMSEKPELIIQKGIYKADGNGGNHSYEFVNGEYIYECAIIVLGEGDSPSAYLLVYQQGKEILSQRATIVIR
ncbi:MAG: hypothetical protein EAZ89_12225 [Bacteroidetes bacterium]|nr:MAG: hypothetical protein EAZ89_12225 [Bacteroidota bacterium]